MPNTIKEFEEAKKKINEGHVRDILKDTMRKAAMNQFAQNNFKPSKIPDEKIDQAFAIIDAHTRILDNLNVLNNYNLTVNVISTVMMNNPEWNSSEETCEKLILDYFNVYIDYDKINQEDPNETLLRDNIKKYIVNSCLTYYAVYHKDRELLLKFNKNISDSVKIILKEINTQRPKASSIAVDTKNEGLPKEVLAELESKENG